MKTIDINSLQIKTSKVSDLIRNTRQQGVRDTVLSEIRNTVREMNELVTG